MPFPAHAAPVVVDFGRVTKSEVNAHAVGINLSWLLDSDLRRKQPVPMSQVLADLHVGALRFPFGHLADNYLWHTPPYDNAANGLRPKVASLSLPPAKWSWAVKPDGSMPHGMDFDEYLSLCEKLGAKPLVCVNALSFKYPGGPTYQQLKASAVAWVTYAMKQRYRVAYWQIGNEVEHRENARWLPMAEYVALYEDFARAMKAADPGAQIGPGVLGMPAYYKAIAKQCPELIDFASVHQYMYDWRESCVDYAGWRDCHDTFVSRIELAANVLAEAGLPQVKLLVTETGVSAKGLAVVNNIYKALWCFEVLMNELSHPAVGYAFYWTTHTPWEHDGNNVEPTSDVGVALRLRTNARTPTGEIIRLINRNLLDQFVSAERVNARQRCYAMRSADRRNFALFLLNKDDQPAVLSIPLGAAAGKRIAHCSEFAGKSPDDVAPVVRDRPAPEFGDGALRMTLTPLSLTIVRLVD